MTLDDFSPDDLDRAAAACEGLPLPAAMPDHFPGLLAVSLGPSDADLCDRLLELPPGELAVVYDFLREQAAAGAALAAV